MFQAVKHKYSLLISIILCLLSLSLIFSPSDRIWLHIGSMLAGKYINYIIWNEILFRWGIIIGLISLISLWIHYKKNNNISIINFLISNSLVRRFSPYSFIIISGILILILRILLSMTGHNHDFPSWCIVGNAVSNGENVYTSTSRYNYGPIFSIFLGLLWRLSNMFIDQVDAFRSLIILTLTIVDTTIACIIFHKLLNINKALAYLLNPISFVIVAYQNQFDNLAILFAIIGVQYIQKHENKYNDLLGAIFISISLITKHILLLFPVWILFKKGLSLKSRVTILTVSYTGFIISFVPYLPEGMPSILLNVFNYPSLDNFPLLYPILNWGHLDLFNFIHSHSRQTFLLLILIFGWIMRNESPDTSFSIYLILIVALTSGLYNNYLTIPIFGLIMISNNIVSLWLFWLYVTISTVIMLFHQDLINLSSSLLSESLIGYFLFESSVIYTILCFILFLYVIIFYAHSSYKKHIYNAT